MNEPIILDRTCLKQGGDLATGILLSRIQYWASQPEVYWIAKSREGWLSETGLSLKQYRRAIKVLQTKRLIIVKVMKRVGSHGQNLTHIRVPDATPISIALRAFSDRSTIYSTISNKSTHSNCVCSLTTAQGTISNEHGVEQAENKDVVEQETKQSTGALSTGLTTGLNPKGWLMKASEILNKQKHTAKPAAGLASHWKACMAVEYGGYQKALTLKSVGQLKHLVEQLGPEQARQVVTYVISHWWKFASHAGSAAGTSWPTDPHIGFVLAHHDVAVNLLTLEVTKTPPPPNLVEVPVQPIAAGAEEQPIHTLTSQELTELLEDLKSP